MEQQADARAAAPAEPGKGGPLWCVLFGGLVIWQGWMTLTLFGPDHAWRRLLDERPILSGRHPLHFYHAYLGAQSFYARGTFYCFDPSFQALYPKSPVFDSGSRPGELFLVMAHGANRPAAYKIGLAVCCCLAPFLLLIAARGAGLGRGASCLAVALGLLVWWGNPGRQALEAGDLDLLLAGLAATAFMGLLVRFDRAPGFWCWVGMVAAGWLGVFAHPFLFLLLCPLVLVYYASVGTRHELVWHLALLAGLAATLAGNVFWLIDLVRYLWIRLPLEDGADLLSHRTFHTVWQAQLWGSAADRTLTMALAGLAAVGVWLLNRNRQRAAARVLGFGTAGFLALAVAGISSTSLGRLGTSQFLVAGLWFAVPPAAFALAQVCGGLCRWAGSPWRGAALVAGLLAGVALAEHRLVAEVAGRCCYADPLTVGLDDERAALVETVKKQTTPDARVLWEDRPGGRTSPRWTPLLPLWTGRAFIGGLDPEAGIEHAYAGLFDQALAGRPVGSWEDAELRDFCRRYNVGWVVCWSPAVVSRFRHWKEAREVQAVSDGEPGVLFALRPLSPHPYFLKGQGRVVCADHKHIALADVVPDNGQVVLSMHFQAGLQASPGRVQVEREPDTEDPIPFIRLTMPGPVARITLTLERP